MYTNNIFSTSEYMCLCMRVKKGRQLACFTSYLRLHTSNLKNSKTVPSPPNMARETKFQMLFGMGQRSTKNPKRV
jgi:hypothetical protein